MKDFVAIDFETANPKRVSACSLGYAKVADGQVIESKEYLIKPVGGHAPFQSKIHGIREEHTFDKPNFGELYPSIADIFQSPLIAHSLFDKQVLNALSIHFDLGLNFEYNDTLSLAKEVLPYLKNHKLKTLAKHFGCPAFKHHNAMDDACTCADIYLKISEHSIHSTVEQIHAQSGDISEFKGLIMGILADNEVNYKEAYELMYWLEDHDEISKKCAVLFTQTHEMLDDDHLDHIEAEKMRLILKRTLDEVEYF